MFAVNCVIDCLHLLLPWRLAPVAIFACACDCCGKRQSNYSYQYRWVLTSAYLRGELALVLLVLVWVVGVLSMLTVRGGPLRRWLSPSSSPPSSSSSSSFLLFLLHSDDCSGW